VIGDATPPGQVDGTPERLSSQAIAGAVAARMDWAVAALRTLVGIDSVAPDERACQEALAGLLQGEGLAPRLVPLPETLRVTDGFVDAGLPLVDRPNLVVTMGGERGGRSLVLNSHVDTVPWIEGVERWQWHPLSGAIHDGFLYGRGAVDAKGQVLAAATAALALRDLGYDPAGRLVLQSVVCEEPTGNGTLALCAGGWLADAAVVLEPTGSTVAHGHRGIAGLRIGVRGRAGHAAVPGSGSNAILGAARLATTLAAALDDWSDPADAAYGPPVLNVGRIAGGESIFTVPDACTVECGVRYAPGTYERILQHIRRRARRVDGASADGDHQMEVFAHFDAAEVPPDSDLPATLLSCVRHEAPESQGRTFPAGCDARHFVNRFAVPAVVFGPGDLAVAHAVDERLSLDEWERAMRALARFVVRWCG
jgi:acetylornithine deacetylase